MSAEYSIFSLALGLGILHALDADHIMAVSGLSARRASLRDTLRYCINWALGHGLILLLLGSCVLLLGMAIPDRLSAIAEILVSLVLIGIGVWLLWSLFRQNAHLHFHRHDGLPRHAHWHSHAKHSDNHQSDDHRHKHSAIFVGVLHGTAGSAPLMALLPLSMLKASPWQGMAYLALFCTGVLVAMLIFGGVLGSALNWLARFGSRAIDFLRGGMAVGSIGVGGHLLFSSVVA